MDRVRIEQGMARAGYHDGIEHGVCVQRDQVLNDRFDVGGVAEHADLDGCRRQVGFERGNLACQHGLGREFNFGNAQGVLRGQRRNDRTAHRAEGVHGFQVGLDSGPAAGVRSGNGPRNGFFHSVTPSASGQQPCFDRILNKK